MHCFSRACNKQLWRVAEWLVRKRTLVRRAVVVRPAAAAVLPVAVVDVVDPLEAVADQVAARAAVVVDVPQVVAVDRVAAAAHQVVVAEAAKVVVGRAVAVVDVPLVVVDKVVAEEAVAQVVVAAADLLAAADREVEAAVVDVLPAVAGAAETANSLSSSGASRVSGAPFFY